MRILPHRQSAQNGARDSFNSSRSPLMVPIQDRTRPDREALAVIRSRPRLRLARRRGLRPSHVTFIMNAFMVNTNAV